jgi:hypothetical protein
MLVVVEGSTGYRNDETLESIGRVRHQLGLTEITPDNQLPDSNRVINVVGLLSRY